MIEHSKFNEETFACKESGLISDQMNLYLVEIAKSVAKLFKYTSKEDYDASYQAGLSYLRERFLKVNPLIMQEKETAAFAYAVNLYKQGVKKFWNKRLPKEI